MPLRQMSPASPPHPPFVPVSPDPAGRAATLAALRRLLPRMEGLSSRALPFGIPAIDRHLPQGGLTLGALHEVIPDGPGELPAAFAFLMALMARMPAGRPLLLVRSQQGLAGQGDPCGHGLGAFGLDPGRLVLVAAGSEYEALWAVEEALRSTVPAAIAGLLGAGLDLKASQRLQLAAQQAQRPLFLLRPAEAASANAAVSRWRVRAAPAGRDGHGLIVRRRWVVELERCRNGRPGAWRMEWDHAAHRFSLAAEMADPALPVGGGEERFRRAG